MSSSDFLCRIGDYREKEITGKQFNELFPDIEFVKLTNKDEKHNGFQFQDGINAYKYRFKHDTPCSEGGLYFTLKDHAHVWLCYKRNALMYHMRKVTIPDDAKVYIETNHNFKTDKFNLGPKEIINIDMYVKFINYWYGDHIRVSYILQTLQSKELYLKVVESDGIMLAFIPYEMKDEEICSIALKSSIYARDYVPPAIMAKINKI